MQILSPLSSTNNERSRNSRRQRRSTVRLRSFQSLNLNQIISLERGHRCGTTGASTFSAASKRTDWKWTPTKSPEENAGDLASNTRNAAVVAASSATANAKMSTTSLWTAATMNAKSNLTKCEETLPGTQSGTGLTSTTKMARSASRHHGNQRRNSLACTIRLLTTCSWAKSTRSLGQIWNNRKRTN